MTANCETCRYCYTKIIPSLVPEGKGTVGRRECRRAAPMANSGIAMWPMILKEDDWCGEYEAKAAAAIVVPPVQSVTSWREFDKPLVLPSPCADCGTPFGTLHKPDCPRLPAEPPPPLGAPQGGVLICAYCGLEGDRHKLSCQRPGHPFSSIAG